MKKFIAIIMLVLCSVLFVGCSYNNVVDKNDVLINRFVPVEYDDCFQIYVDLETDVMYLFARQNIDQLGITVLMDSNGKPLLYSESDLHYE